MYSKTQILRSSLSRFSNLNQPEDFFVDKKYIPTSTYFKQYSLTNNFKNDTVYFSFNVDDIRDYDLIDMFYLKFTLPSVKCKNSGDFIKYQELFGLKCIRKYTIKINNYIEEYDTNTLLYTLQDYVKFRGYDWKNFCKTFIGYSYEDFIDEKFSFTDTKEYTVYLPIFVSLFLTNEKIKTNLISNAKIEIIININKIDDVAYITNRNFKFDTNFIDKINYSFIIQLLDLNLSSSPVDENYKNTIYTAETIPENYFVNTTSYVTKSYYGTIYDEYEFVINKEEFKKTQKIIFQASFNHLSNDVTGGGGGVSINSENGTFLYGFDLFSARINILNTLLYINNIGNVVNDGNSTYLNLKTGELVFNKDFLLEIPENNTYEIKTGEGKILFSIILIGNLSWNNLTQDIYLNINNNYLNNNIKSVFAYKELYFYFTNDEDVLSINNTARVDFMKRQKLVEGIYYDTDNKQKVYGFVDYVLQNDNLLINDFIASLPTTYMDDLKPFVNESNVKYMNLFNTSFSLDNEKRIKIKDIRINDIDIENDLLDIYNNVNHVDNNSIKTYDNLTLNMSAYNTDGVFSVLRSDTNEDVVIKCKIDTSQFSQYVNTGQLLKMRTIFKINRLLLFNNNNIYSVSDNYLNTIHTRFVNAFSLPGIKRVRKNENIDKYSSLNKIKKLKN